MKKLFTAITLLMVSATPMFADETVNKYILEYNNKRAVVLEDDNLQRTKAKPAIVAKQPQVECTCGGRDCTNENCTCAAGKKCDGSNCAAVTQTKGLVNADGTTAKVMAVEGDYILMRICTNDQCKLVKVSISQALGLAQQAANQPQQPSYQYAPSYYTGLTTSYSNSNSCANGSCNVQYSPAQTQYYGTYGSPTYFSGSSYGGYSYGAFGGGYGQAAGSCATGNCR